MRKLKKIFSIILTAAMIFGICPTPVQATSYADGIYTGIGNGWTYYHIDKNGVMDYANEIPEADRTDANKIKLEVTMVSGLMTAINVTSHNEGPPDMMPQYMDDYGQQYIQSILAAQSTDVDVVSGATSTCHGIKEAVDSALAQAEIASDNIPDGNYSIKVYGWKETSEGLSMMSPLLGEEATLTVQDGEITATITFVNATIMNMEVGADSVTEVWPEYGGETPEVGTGYTGAYNAEEETNAFSFPLTTLDYPTLYMASTFMSSGIRLKFDMDTLIKEGGGTYITGFETIEDIDAGTNVIPKYTDANAVKNVLPTEATIVSTEETVSILSWTDTDGYDPGTAESYTFTGVLGDLPEGYVNPYGYAPTVEVVVANGEISGFEVFDDVDGGTNTNPIYAGAAAVTDALPTEVTILNSAATVPVIEWTDTDGYDEHYTSAARNYTFTAVLGDLPEGYGNPDNLTVTVEVKVKGTISGFEETVENIDAGTNMRPGYKTVADIIRALPARLTIEDTDERVDVTWTDSDGYDSTQAGSYTFTATLGTLPDGYSNDNNIVPEIEAVLEDEELNNTLHSWGSDSAYGDAVYGLTTLTGGNMAAVGYFGMGTYDFKGMGQGGIDVFAAVLSSGGKNLISMSTLGSSGYDEASAIDKTSDGGFVIGGNFEGANGDFAGMADKYLGGDDAFIAKYDALGKLEWISSIGGSDNDRIYSVRQDSEDAYYIAGTTESEDGDFEGLNKGGDDAFVAKMDSSGTLIWVKVIGGTSSEYVGNNTLSLTSEGPVLGFYTTSTDGDFSDYTTSAERAMYFAKFDESNGDIKWMYNYGTDSSGKTSYYVTGMRENSSGGFVATGYVTRADSDAKNWLGVDTETDYQAFLLKLDDDGAFSWIKTLGSNLSLTSYAVMETEDDYKILGEVKGNGSSTKGDFSGKYFFGGREDIFFASFEKDGHLSDLEVIGGNGREHAYAMTETESGYLVIGGDETSDDGYFVNSDDYGSYDAYVLMPISDDSENMTIRGFAPIEDIDGGTTISPKYETSSDVINALPEKVTIKGTDVTVNVSSWETASYDPETAGSYMFTAQLDSIPEGYDNKNNATASAEVVIINGNIQGFVDLGDINAGTVEIPIYSNADAVKEALPSKVTILRADAEVSITGWDDKDGYDPETVGCYAFKAILGNIPSGFANPNNLTVEVKVVISEPLGVEKIMSMGGKQSDLLYSLSELSDGRIIASGYSKSTDGDFENLNGSYDGYISILSADRNTLTPAAIILGSSRTDYAYTTEATADGGFIVGGSFYSADEYFQSLADSCYDSYDGFVAKYTSTLELEWMINIGGSGQDFIRSVRQIKDGSGYYASGYTKSFDGDMTGVGKGYDDVFVAKLDNDGNILWIKSVGSTDNDNFDSDIALSEDGGCVIAGQTKQADKDFTGTNLYGEYDLFYAKLNSEDGTIDWVETYGSDDNDYPYALIETSDGGYLSVGQFSGIGQEDFLSLRTPGAFVLKLDSEGKCEWVKSISNSEESDVKGFDVTETQEGFAVIGYTEVSGGDFGNDTCYGENEIFVARYNEEGTRTAAYLFGGTGDDSALGVLETFDGKLAICGSTYSSDGIFSAGNAGKFDAYIAFLSEDADAFKIEIEGFDAIEDIDAGIEGSAIYADADEVRAVLPETLTISNTEVTVPVESWTDTDSYDVSAAGSYTFTAVLGTLPSGYANNGNHTVTVEVVVSVDMDAMVDGSYTVDVYGWHATKDQESMMASALDQDATLQVADGEITATIKFIKTTIYSMEINGNSIKEIWAEPDGTPKEGTGITGVYNEEDESKTFTFTLSTMNMPKLAMNIGEPMNSIQTIRLNFDSDTLELIEDETGTQIISFEDIDDINGGTVSDPIYANADAVKEVLPDTVTVDEIRTGGAIVRTESAISVTDWEDTDGYDPSKAGSYTFTAVLGELPEGYTLGSGVAAAVEVIIEGAESNLKSISLDTTNAKLAYRIGDPLDISGLIVTGTYDNDSTAVITITEDNVTGFDSSQATESQTLTVIVDGKTATYAISISEKSDAAPVKEIEADNGKATITRDDINDLSDTDNVKLDFDDVEINIPVEYLKSYFGSDITGTASLEFEENEADDDTEKSVIKVMGDDDELVGAIELNLTLGEQSISDLGGRIKITINLTNDQVKDLKKADSRKLCYYNPISKELEDMNATFDLAAKTVTFYTDHFSTYAIVAVEEDDDGGRSSSSNSGRSDATYSIKASAGMGGSISPEGTVKVSKNRRKTFTIKAGNGYEISDVLVDGESIGVVSTYTFSSVTKGHTIKVIFEKIETGMSFSDMSGHWAEEAVNYVAEKGLMNGTESGKFSPDISLTRGMFVTIMGRLHDAEISGYTSSSFSDVDMDKYYGVYIEWASQNGLVQGVGEGIFNPDKAISREEVATIFTRYRAFAGISSESQGMITFADQNEISPWALDGVTEMQKAGLFKGNTKNQFLPKKSMTRAEAATLFARSLGF